MQRGGDGLPAEVFDALVQLPGLRRALVPRVRELRPDNGQLLRQCVDAFVRRQAENRSQVNRVEVAAAESGQGKVNAGNGLTAKGAVCGLPVSNRPMALPNWSAAAAPEPGAATGPDARLTFADELVPSTARIYRSTARIYRADVSATLKDTCRGR